MSDSETPDAVTAAAERLLHVAQGPVRPGWSGFVLAPTADILTVARAALAAAEQAARLREQLTVAWRFWASIEPPVQDRGFALIRVHPERLAAFDALFRSSPAGQGEPSEDR